VWSGGEVNSYDKSFANRTLFRIALSSIRVMHKFFYNTPIHRLGFVTRTYERLFHLAVDRNSIVEVSFDGLTIMVPGKDIAMLPSLLNHTYEAYELRLLKQLLGPGMTFIDVGANVGLYSIVGARCVSPNGTVYSFEPVPENFEILNQNLSNNGIANVETAKAAVGDRAGTFSMYLEDNSACTHSLVKLRDSYRPDQKIEVEAITLDGYFQDRMPILIDTMKIDVEGYEAQVLSGASIVLSRTNHLFIEYEPGAFKATHTIAQFIDLLKCFPFIYGLNERSQSLSLFKTSDFYESTYLNLLASKTDLLETLS
jgi:FkbM family methyltransferase